MCKAHNPNNIGINCLSFTQRQDCIFQDSNNATMKLDLRPLYDLMIKWNDGDGGEYIYSICSNNLP